jgi:hypothetical protein
MVLRASADVRSRLCVSSGLGIVVEMSVNFIFLRDGSKGQTLAPRSERLPESEDREAETIDEFVHGGIESGCLRPHSEPGSCRD